ncbi:MAG: aminotransferase class I/II-fold pyridoxal phosphate-dependent enzyme [Bacteroidota bacterium]
MVNLSRRKWLQLAGMSASGLAAGIPLTPESLSATRAADAPSEAGMIRLSSNENPYGPSQQARTAMQNAFEEACRYPYAGATKDLTRIIAEKEGVSEDHVFVASGSGEILAMTGMAYGLSGGEMVAADPTYQGLVRYAEKVGAYIHRVPLNDNMVHDLGSMESRITPAVRLVFVCNPNNPTATICEPAALKDFCIDTAKKSLVFLDEAYIELLANPQEHTMVDLVRQGHNVILSRTFSKIHGLAGMRIGYAIARPDIIKRISNFKMGMPNVLGLRAAIASYQDESFQAFSREKMAAGRQLVYKALDQVEYKYTPSYTSFVFFHTGMPIQDFQSKMKERSILIGRPFPPFLDWARVSIGKEEEMHLFADALQDLVSTGS